MTIRTIAALGAIAMLTACGGSDTEVYRDSEGNEVTVERQGDDDSEVRIESAGGTTVINTGKFEGKLPFGLKPYPGAEIVSSTIGTSEGQTGGMLLMTTSDDQDDVLAYYEKQAKAGGLDIKTRVESGDMKMLAGEGDKDGAFSLQAMKQPDGTQITLIVGMGE